MTDLLDVMLADSRFCGECGAELPEPGVPCACGQVPPVTREEAAEALRQPGAVTTAEVARDRERARKHQDDAAADYAAADRRLHVELGKERDDAEAAAAAAQAVVQTAAQVLAGAKAREQDAQAHEKDARANYTEAANAEEAARRTRASAAERTDALTRANNAAVILEGDRAQAAAATGLRAAAQQQLAEAERLAGEAGNAVKAAAAQLADPGRAPRTGPTLLADLPRLAVTPAEHLDLDDDERASVRVLVRAIARASGVEHEIEAEKAGRIEDLLRGPECRCRCRWPDNWAGC